MKIAVLIGWNGSVIRNFIEAGERLGIDVWAKYPRLDPLDDAFVDFVREADAVFIHHFSSEQLYVEIVKRLEEILKTKKFVIAVDPVLSHLSTVDRDKVAKASAYYTYGGRENIERLLGFIQSLVEGGEYKEPLSLPFSGIYDPETGETILSPEDYLERGGNRKRVGILFYRSAWVDGDTKVVKAISRSLYRRGLYPVPVFAQGFGNRERGIESNEEVIRRFFMREGKPVVDAVISLMSFNLTKEGIQVLRDLDVPVFQGLIYYYRDEEEWYKSDGLDLISSIISVTMPEMSGVIEPILVGTVRKHRSKRGEVFRTLEPVEEQVELLAERVKKWIGLRYKPNHEKRIAIILHSGSSYKDLEANIGTATGLDTLETVANLLKSMKSRGYSVEGEAESGKELIGEILRRRSFPETDWTSLEDIRSSGGVVDEVSISDFLRWFSEIPEEGRVRVRERWGIPERGKRSYMFDGGSFPIPGIIYGNVFVGVQPKRIEWQDDKNSIQLIHDSTTPPTPYWIAFYKWIETVFKADAIVHVGTHGTLEFTPGKGVGLSKACFPQISIGTVPHVYIYSTNVPGEGITAKRRSYAVLIDHITPPTVVDEVPDEVKKLEDLLDEFEESERAGDEMREKIVLRQIRELAEGIGMSVDFSDPDKATHEIEHRLNMFKDSVVSKGLHVFGQLPSEEDLAEYVIASTRFDQDSLYAQYGKEKAKEAILSSLRGGGTLPQKEATVLQGLKRSAEMEVENFIRALEGKFIEPGPSGSLARGRYDILPTGRNFHGTDQSKVPTLSSWQVGSTLAERLIERRRKELGYWPRVIGFILWSTDVFRSDGELVAQILRTLGVRPLWQEGTRKVKGVELIPLSELGRPRIDVIVEISGIVRDNLYNIVEIIDDAVRLASEAEEPEDMNYVRMNSLQLGSTNRVFSSKPGAYGSGVSHAVESSLWKDEGDLADVFIEWMGYSYGRGRFGVKATEHFMKMSSKIDTIVHKREIDEIDILDDSCNYSYVGGFYLASKKSGSSPSLFFEDTFNPSRPKVRTMAEEVERVSLMKMLNDKWINSQKNQGYRGATEILKKVEHLYGWAATTKTVGRGVFRRVAEKFALDRDMREWFMKENPWALEGIMKRLLEASARGLWQGDEDVKSKLQRLYAEVQSEIE